MQRYHFGFAGEPQATDTGKWVKATDAEREVQLWKDCAERWADGYERLLKERPNLAAELAATNARIKDLEEANAAQRKVIQRLAGKNKIFEFRGDELVGVWTLEEARRDGWLV